MAFTRNSITCIVIYDGTEHRLQTYHAEYRNLRDLVADRIFIEGFGDCGGLDRCATCLVEIDERPVDGDRNEEVTLRKAGILIPT